jgi:hypothetical protein
VDMTQHIEQVFGINSQSLTQQWVSPVITIDVDHGRPVSGSQIRIVPSSPPVATQVPSGAIRHRPHLGCHTRRLAGQAAARGAWLSLLWADG